MPSTIAITRAASREAASRPGVLIRVFWHEQRLASEFMPLNRPARYEVGAEPGCRFALEKVPRFALVEVGGGEATVGFSPHLEGERVGPEGVTGLEALISRGEAEPEPGGHRLTLDRRDVVRLWRGPICFEVLKVKAPPLETLPGWEGVDFTWANVFLAVLALTGAAILSLAFHEPELPGDLEVRATTQRLVKTLTRLVNLPPPPKVRAGSEAISAPAKDGKRVGQPKPNAPSRPSTSDHPGHATPHQAVESLFDHDAVRGTLATPGLGEELRHQLGGMVGAGLGGAGLALKGEGRGLGGVTEGIGSVGIHHPTGTGVPGLDDCGMKCKTKPDLITASDPVIDCAHHEGCYNDKELIRQVIHQNQAAFRFCYEARLNAKPSLAGKVSVRFLIDSAGRVPSASVVSSTALDVGLEQCVLGRTRLLQFPSRHSDGLLQVTYPFVFRSGP